MRTPLPPALFLLCLALNTIGHFGLPLIQFLTQPLSFAGVPLLLLGIYLTVTGSILFSQHQTNINTFKAPTKLVTDGPFRYSRNPMYLGFTVSLFGTTLLFGSIGAGVGTGLFFIAANFWYIPFEERKCQESLGPDYENYCKSVRRWL